MTLQIRNSSWYIWRTFLHCVPFSGNPQPRPYRSRQLLLVHLKSFPPTVCLYIKSPQIFTLWLLCISTLVAFLVTFNGEMESPVTTLTGSCSCCLALSPHYLSSFSVSLSYWLHLLWPSEGIPKRDLSRCRCTPHPECTLCDADWSKTSIIICKIICKVCLLYTSDAADE